MTTDIQTLKSIGALEEAVKNLAQVAIRMDDKALEERKAIDDRVDSIREDVSDLIRKVELLSNKVNSMGPVVEKIDDAYQQAIGAKHMGKLIWGVIIAVCGLAISVGSHLISYFHLIPGK
jgi:hypothetical protein